MRKRVYSVLISFCMVFCMAPLVQVSAASLYLDKSEFQRVLSNVPETVVKLGFKGKASGEKTYNMNEDGSIKWSLLGEDEVVVGPAEEGNVVCLPTSADSESFFAGLSRLKEIDLSELGTADVKDMTHLFDGCTSLEKLVIGDKFDTSQVRGMDFMFNDCKNLKSIDLNKFNTGEVASMNGMFAGCEKLETLNVSGFCTEKVTNMANMFLNCKSLTALDLSAFNTKLVTDMNGMFFGCNSLKTLNINGFVTDGVKDMHDMFRDCQKLENLVFPRSFITSGVTNMSNMFFGCASIKNLDLSMFDVRSVKDATEMFLDSGLETLNIKNWYFRDIEKFDNIFSFSNDGVVVCCTNDFWNKYCTDTEAIGEQHTPVHHHFKDGRCTVCHEIEKMQQAMVKKEGITWIAGDGYEVGFENDGKFEEGSVLYCRKLDGTGSEEEKIAYELYTKGVSEDAKNTAVFDISVLKPDGTGIYEGERYPAKVYVKLSGGLEKENIKAVTEKSDELSVSLVNGVDEEHKGDYALVTLDSIYPFALYNADFTNGGGENGENSQNGEGSSSGTKGGASGKGSNSTGKGSQTGDMETMIYMMGIMALLSAGAVVVLKKRGKSSK